MWTQLLAGPRDEAEAMRVALAGNALARARLSIRAGLALAVDPNDTRQVFYLAMAVDRETLPRVAARLAAHPTGRELLRERAAIDSKHVDSGGTHSDPSDMLWLDGKATNPGTG